MAEPHFPNPVKTPTARPSSQSKLEQTQEKIDKNTKANKNVERSDGKRIGNGNAGAQTGKAREKSELQNEYSEKPRIISDRNEDKKGNKRGPVEEANMTHPISNDIITSSILAYAVMALLCIPHKKIIVGLGVLFGVGLGGYNYITSYETRSDFTIDGLLKAMWSGGISGYMSSSKVFGTFYSKFFGGMTELFVNKNIDIAIMDVTKVFVQSLVDSLIQGMPISNTQKLLLNAQADIVISEISSVDTIQRSERNIRTSWIWRRPLYIC